MNIRKARPSDANGVARVQVDAWQTTYKGIVPDDYLSAMTYTNREQKWKEIITSQSVFVAETEADGVVGFSNGGKERTGKYKEYTGELYALYVLKEYQRKGIGKLLLRAVIDYLINNNLFSMTVAVLEENPSRQFYESFGAKRIDTIEIEILGKRLNESIYGWEDIREIN